MASLYQQMTKRFDNFNHECDIDFIDKNKFVYKTKLTINKDKTFSKLTVHGTKEDINKQINNIRLRHVRDILNAFMDNQEANEADNSIEDKQEEPVEEEIAKDELTSEEKNHWNYKAMEAYKKEIEVLNEIQSDLEDKNLEFYINKFDNDLNKKSDITPKLIEEFIIFIKHEIKEGK